MKPHQEFKKVTQSELGHQARSGLVHYYVNPVTNKVMITMLGAQSPHEKHMLWQVPGHYLGNLGNQKTATQAVIYEAGRELVTCYGTPVLTTILPERLATIGANGYAVELDQKERDKIQGHIYLVHNPHVSHMMKDAAKEKGVNRVWLFTLDEILSQPQTLRYEDQLQLLKEFKAHMELNRAPASVTHQKMVMDA